MESGRNFPTNLERRESWTHNLISPYKFKELLQGRDMKGCIYIYATRSVCNHNFWRRCDRNTNRASFESWNVSRQDLGYGAPLLKQKNHLSDYLFLKKKYFVDFSSKLSKTLKIDNNVCLMCANTFWENKVLRAKQSGSDTGSKTFLRFLLAEILFDKDL